MKLLVSYDPDTDGYWRTRFSDLFGEQFPMHSVGATAFDYDGCEDFKSRLVSAGYLDQETVVVVLVGPKTYARRQVDWEIAAALELLESRHPGLLAIRLPTHPDHGKQTVNPRRVPQRLVDNLKSGYVRLHDWTESARDLEVRLHEALQNARYNAYMIDNRRSPMARDMLR